jgi:hypothetical protein
MKLESPSSRSTALIRQMIKISRRERPSNTSRSFGRRKFPRAGVLLRAKSAARNPFVLSWQPERVCQPPHQIQSFGNRLPNNLSIPTVRPVSLKRITTASTRQWRRVVPPVVGLDSPLTSPPPLTSFTGCRSRIMASLTSFLSRRQTDRTTLTFGSCVFLLKQLPPIISWQGFSDEFR